MLTPYQFASNTPILAKDIDGLEAVVYEYEHNASSGEAVLKNSYFDENLKNPNGV